MNYNHTYLELQPKNTNPYFYFFHVPNSVILTWFSSSNYVKNVSNPWIIMCHLSSKEMIVKKLIKFLFLFEIFPYSRKKFIFEKNSFSKLCFKHWRWHAPKSFLEPTWRSNYVKLRKVGTWGPLLTSSIKRG